MQPDIRAADERAKVRLGADAATPAPLLAALARDASLVVRAAVALNPAAPAAADDALAQDGDERVRMVLARKLIAVLPSLSGDEQASLTATAWRNLAVLVADEAERVRALIADLVKQMPGLPRDMILTLARDDSFVVSDPVLRLSPVLTADDLLSLVTDPPAAHTLRSIAGRPLLDGAVCDAIVASADSEAVRQLLSNRSAAIREATLDGLVEHAGGRGEWHEPLARRPALSPRSARMLATIVADRMLKLLSERDDLEPSLLAELRTKVANQQEKTPTARYWGEASAKATPLPPEAAMMAAIRMGDIERAGVILAAAAQVPPDRIRQAARLRNAKAAISLVWRAGFSTGAATAVQAALFYLPPDGMLRPGRDGIWPLSEQEMRWQLTALHRPGQEA